MTAEAFDAQTLIKLESGRILPAGLPTRMWTGPGPILLDIGDGNGSVQWNGASFGNIETDGAVNVEKTAGGVPKRLAIAVGVDGSRGDAQAAIVGTDLGPLTATLLFVVRETAGASLPLYDPGAVSQKANADPEPELTSVNQVLYAGNDTFKIALPAADRERVGDIAVEGNRLTFSNPDQGTSADVRIVYASAVTGAAFDVWTVFADGHGSLTEGGGSSGLTATLQIIDPPKSQDWSFVTDSDGAPLVVRGRTGEMAYNEGLWIFEIEARVHDADRLIVDVWSNATQQARYSGDLFFEFTGELEGGLDISWPN